MSPYLLLQLVCEDVNVDRFYPVLYPKVRLGLGPLTAGWWVARGLGIYGRLLCAGCFSLVSHLVLVMTLPSSQFAKEEPEAQKLLCLTQGCTADDKSLHTSPGLPALEVCLTSGNSHCNLGPSQWQPLPLSQGLQRPSLVTQRRPGKGE